jgi:hypothetical protein
MELTSWLMLGACLQGLVMLVLPKYLTLLPAIVLAYRLVDPLLVTFGIKDNSLLNEGRRGKFTSLVPSQDGTLAKTPSDKEISVVLLAVRSNQ